MDFYGGYKTTFGDFGLDVGVIYYYYPGTGKYLARRRKPRIFEAYIGGTWGPVSLKYFYCVHRFLWAELKTGAGRYRHQRLAVFRLHACTFPFDGGWAVSGARRLAED